MNAPNGLLMVVPCYNEAIRFSQDYWSHIIEQLPEVHFLFVDDGSTDDTLNVLSGITHFPNVKIHNSSINVGKGEAIRKGVLLYRNEYNLFGYVDCDESLPTQTLLSSIRFMSKAVAHEPKRFMVLGSRVKLYGNKIERKIHRHLIGRIITSILGHFWKDIPYDTQCGLKVFRFKPLSLLDESFKTRWFFDIELMMRAQKFYLKESFLLEVPLTNWRDMGGSKLTYKSAPIVLKEIWTICKIIYHQNTSTKR